RGGAGLFSQQSVKSESEAKRDRDPWKSAVTERQIQHPERGEQNGRELPASKTFAEKNCAEKHVHERCHEITETRFNHATDVDRVNEQEPVGCNRESAGQAINPSSRRAHVGDQ